MLNAITIMGRLAADPEIRYTQSQIPVVAFTIACEDDFSTQENPKTYWIDIVAWRTTAQFVSRYFHKGDMIIVDGKLTTRNWEDQNGNKRKAVEVVADRVYFGQAKAKESRSESNYDEADIPDLSYPEIEEEMTGDGDLPF